MDKNGRTLQSYHFSLCVHFVHHYNVWLVRTRVFLRLYLESLQDLSRVILHHLRHCVPLWRVSSPNSTNTLLYTKPTTWLWCNTMPHLWASYSLCLLCAGLSQGLLDSTCILCGVIDLSLYRSRAQSLFLCEHFQGLLVLFQSSHFQPLVGYPDIIHFLSLVMASAMQGLVVLRCFQYSSPSGFCHLRYSLSNSSLEASF